MQIAAAYVRVSTNDQTDYSPSAQLDDIREFCLKNRYLLPDEFIFMEEGISGKEAGNRPAFQEMIRQARKKQNKIKYIIVHKYDRFARNKEDAVLYKALLKKDGVKVISVKEPIPQDDKFAVIYESMLEAMAEYYSLNLAEEVKKGMTKKAQLGGWQTRPPFGYRSEKGTLAIHPQEAEVVKSIFSDFLKGVSSSLIAKRLNQNGFRLHTGNPFAQRHIDYIIQNPAYKGYARWHPAPGETIISKSNFKPILDEETWDEANKKFKEVVKARPRNDYALFHRTHWLSGLVRCSDCESILVINRTNGFFFQCKGYRNGLCPTSHYVTVPVIEQSVLSLLKTTVEDSTLLEGQKINIKRTASGHDNTAMLSMMLSKAQKRLAKAKEAFLAEIDSLEEYRQNKMTIESEISSLKDELAKQSIEHPIDYEKFAYHIQSVIDILESDTAMENKILAASNLIEKVVFFKETKSIDLYLLYNE
ncbi:recombinase family protein [Anaerotignum sp. MB30-C6]|uniref:recombinase family protein n=1 Tax=Anaerotignum sp. MB30-C6 TaxID=3070814 RepID=UPI0027DD7B69|nr:recombinase family protein [Anaerotignum sp. MB30-C6]WMI82062.1 recombinase family protein [Anaerotignum sp. MB30-C6]